MFPRVCRWFFCLWCLINTNYLKKHTDVCSVGMILLKACVLDSFRTSGRRTLTTCVPTSWPYWRAARMPSSVVWWESTLWRLSAGPCCELTLEPWWLSGRPAADTHTKKLVRSIRQNGAAVVMLWTLHLSSYRIKAQFQPNRHTFNFSFICKYTFVMQRSLCAAFNVSSRLIRQQVMCTKL